VAGGFFEKRKAKTDQTGYTPLVEIWKIFDGEVLKQQQIL
jgi:hypothetical protein